MTNKPPRFIWKWCWKVISPVTILVVLSMSIKSMSQTTAQYDVWDPVKVGNSKSIIPLRGPLDHGITGSLSNDDGDGSENGNKPVGLD